MRCNKRLWGVVILTGAVCLAVASAAQAGPWTQLDKLYASDGVAAAEYGDKVAIDGSTILVGGSPAEGAYVYTQGGDGHWGSEVKLSPTDSIGATIIEFGSSVAVDGDTAVVGAFKSTVSGKTQAGVVFIFQKIAGTWTQVAELTASDPTASAKFGISASISADVILIGASGLKIGTKTNCGAAYLFGRDVGGTDNWGQIAKVTASDYNTSNYFGAAASLDGDTALIGAYGGSKAYVFEDDGLGNWNETKKLTGSGNFGIGVSLDGDQAAIGAYKVAVGGNSNAGEAYVLGRDEGGADNWGEIDSLSSPNAEANGYFGKGVALDGRLLAVGAYGENSSAGRTYMFQDDGAGNWSCIDTLAPSDLQAGDQLGWAIDLQGTTVLAGASMGDGKVTDSGAAYVFVPEPTGVSLLVFGAVAMLLAARRRNDGRR